MAFHTMTEQGRPAWAELGPRSRREPLPLMVGTSTAFGVRRSPNSTAQQISYAAQQRKGP
jgi:hypothetical protein